MKHKGGIEIRIYCDICGNGVDVNRAICERCYKQLKYENKVLLFHINDLQGTLNDLERYISELSECKEALFSKDPIKARNSLIAERL